MKTTFLKSNSYNVTLAGAALSESLDLSFLEYRSRRVTGNAGTGQQPSRAQRPRLPSQDVSLSLTRPDVSYTPRPTPQQRAPTSYEVRGAVVASISAGKRRAEPIGNEHTDYDNSESSSSSVETLHITHSTEFAMHLDEDKATVTGGGGSVAMVGFANISGSLQQTLRKHHSVGVTSTISVERTSQITVPAHKHVRVTLKWKRIWQDGIVNLRTTTGVQIAVPYSMTVDLSFDKKTRDL
jgi:hypothetical protein